MVGRDIRAAGLACLAVAAVACSKTEDTAPERRIFGSPPSISSVEIVNIPASPVTCDWTLPSLDALCDLLPELGLDPAFLPDPIPTITLTLTYDEVTFNIRATDPESTPAQSDILLVTSSYVTSSGGQPQELSLAIFDDGGKNHFQFLQKTSFYEEDCTGDGLTCPVCAQKRYELDSNDAMEGDGLFTRGFSFVDTSGGGVRGGTRALELLQDCLVSQKRQAPQFTSNLGGKPVSFKVEAIDRSGNIATWPVKPEITVQPATMTCSGDECLCCILQDANVLTACRQLPGLNGPPGSGYEVGFCHLF